MVTQCLMHLDSFAFTLMQTIEFYHFHSRNATTILYWRN
ncbi:hypothetical protein L248_3123 [Schleiferilactobacillus shenzhenensis LY-73]|uniref:Uncharacterized protein n=1 Tax=Schleiferilactobacillus shenzhenensis LY-73 TaxID=1231336 RepID=U4TJG2_9LACO|nr:hypothetical protein L248_3123 [Schleiferilactobacillus shenzhenensis LY-73]